MGGPAAAGRERAAGGRLKRQGLGSSASPASVPRTRNPAPAGRRCASEWAATTQPHEFATITPGDVPEVRVRLTPEDLVDPDRLFDWAPLGVGYPYPATEAARVRVPSHEYVPKVLPAVVQAKEATMVRLEAAPSPRAQRLANLVTAIRDRLPAGLSVRDPIRPIFAQVLVTTWPPALHCELTIRSDAPAVMLHIELDPDAPGRDVLRAAFDALAQPLASHCGARLHHRPSTYGSFETRLPNDAGPDVVPKTFAELVAQTRDQMQRAVQGAFELATPVTG